MSFKGFSTNSSLLKNSISSKKLLQDNQRNIRLQKKHLAVNETISSSVNSTHKTVIFHTCATVTEQIMATLLHHYVAADSSKKKICSCSSSSFTKICRKDNISMLLLWDNVPKKISSTLSLNKQIRLLLFTVGYGFIIRLNIFKV